MLFVQAGSRRDPEDSDVSTRRHEFRSKQWRIFAQGWLGWFGYGDESNRVQVAARRVYMEVIHVRWLYSARHNAAIVAVLAIIYPLALVGAIRLRDRPLVRLMLTVVAAHLLLVALTFYDVDGRYLLFVFPLIGVLAACGASALVERFSDSRNPALLVSP